MPPNESSYFRGDNCSGAAYDSMQSLYQHQLPTVMTLNRYFTALWYTHTHTHTRLTALFRDYPGEPVPER